MNRRVDQASKSGRTSRAGRFGPAYLSRDDIARAGFSILVSAELIERVAAIALRKRLRLKRGDHVMIETWPHGLEVARAFAFQARAMGVRPLLFYEDEGTFFRVVETLDAAKAMKVGAPEWAALSRTQGYVFLPGPADLPRAWKMGWGKFTAGYPDNEEFYARAKRHRVRGVRMLWGYTSEQRAAAYGVDLAAWRQMLMTAACVEPDAIRTRGSKLSKALLKAKEVHLTSPNGTDLRLRLMGRTPQVDDGSVREEDLKNGDNITQAPAGQCWVAPDESSTQGVVAFDRPSPGIGGWVKGIRFEFRAGKLIARSFEENEGAFERPFAANKGPKDRLGMLSFGLNPEMRAGYPQDPIVAGVVNLSLGSNGELDGKNKTGFSFSASLSNATLTLDGRPVVEGGRLLA